jgi:hypothetical protein
VCRMARAVPPGRTLVLPELLLGFAKTHQPQASKRGRGGGEWLRTVANDWTCETEPSAHLLEKPGYVSLVAELLRSPARCAVVLASLALFYLYTADRK